MASSSRSRLIPPDVCSRMCELSCIAELRHVTRGLTLLVRAGDPFQIFGGNDSERDPREGIRPRGRAPSERSSTREARDVARGGTLPLSMVAVGQTMAGVDFLCVGDKVAILDRIISVAEESLWPAERLSRGRRKWRLSNPYNGLGLSDSHHARRQRNSPLDRPRRCDCFRDSGRGGWAIAMARGRRKMRMEGESATA